MVLTSIQTNTSVNVTSLMELMMRIFIL